MMVSLELCNDCTANCLFCRNEKGELHDFNPNGGSVGIPKGTMPLEMALKIVEQVSQRALIVVLYTNGEPLMYKQIDKVIQHATDHHLASMIATNGQLLNDDNIAKLLEAQIDFIKIAISGFTQETYRQEVRNGNVERIKDNVRKLVEKNREGNYKTVIMLDFISYNYNRHELEDVKKFCNELNVMLNIRPGNPMGGLEGKENPLDCEPLPLKVSCDWLWKAMQINYNGDILPCCECTVWSGSKPYDTIDVDKTNVLDVFNGALAQTMRKTIATKGRSAYPICSACQRKGITFKW